MAKKRIYEVAKELGIENKIVVKKAQDLGFDVKSHMSSLDDKQVSKLVDSFKSANTTKPSTEKDSKYSSRKEKTKIKNFLKKVIDKYREWCYCMVVQNNKRKTKQRRLPTSSLCFFVFYLKNLFNAMGG